MGEGLHYIRFANDFLDKTPPPPRHRQQKRLKVNQNFKFKLSFGKVGKWGGSGST